MLGSDRNARPSDSQNRRRNTDRDDGRRLNHHSNNSVVTSNIGRAPPAPRLCPEFPKDLSGFKAGHEPNRRRDDFEDKRGFPQQSRTNNYNSVSHVNSHESRRSRSPKPSNKDYSHVRSHQERDSRPQRRSRSPRASNGGSSGLNRGAAISKSGLPLPVPANPSPKTRRKSPPRASNRGTERRRSPTASRPVSNRTVDSSRRSREKRTQSKATSHSTRTKSRERSVKSTADNRVSALKRLGPKLKITDRLGCKRPRKDAAVPDGTPEDGESEGQKTRIELKCPHCHEAPKSFGTYVKHLTKETHINAMKQLKKEHFLTMTRMRKKQRLQQKEIEDEMTRKEKEAGKEVEHQTTFCKTCRLTYRQNREEHEKSKMHDLINSFLHPVCIVCDLSFGSPMAYENHLASLPHVKRKSYMNAEEESLDLQKKVETAEDDDSDNVDLSAIDINDFLTLDEVGDAEEDENEIDPEGNEADKGVALTKSAIQQVIEKKDAKETEKTVVKIEVEEVKSEPEGPVGEEYVKPVTMYYCDICHKYLPRADDDKADDVKMEHCISGGHRKAFERYTQDLAESDHSTNLKAEALEEVKSEVSERQNYIDDDDQLDFEAEDSVSGK